MSEKLQSKENVMGTMPEGKLLFTMAFPMVISMMVQAFYNIYDSLVVASGQESVYLPLLVTLYCAVPFGVVALVCLDKLLCNIRKEQSFIMQNVTLLRIISYCCFGEVFVFVYITILKPFAAVVMIACAFMGLILRVVKNVFEQAVRIREENDFTI